MDLAQLARELRDLAEREQLAGRKGELESLADDLAAGSDLEVWAEIDLVGSFACPESLTTPVAGTAKAAAGRNGWSWASVWARIRRIRDEPLEAALGVLVFLPLLVTWAGLRMASSAYGELAKSDPKQASRPFLQLWQSGFGGHLSPYERFDSVALTAVGLICVLLLLATWHAWVRTRAERELVAEETERDVLLARLTSVMTRAQLALVPHRYGSPKQFGAELTAAARQLRSLNSQAVKSHEKLVLAADASQTAATGLRAATDRLTLEVPQLGAAVDRIETAIRAGADGLRDAHTKAVDAVRTSQESTTRTGQDNVTAVREVGDRIVQAGALIDTALKELVTAQRDLAGVSGQALAATDRASEAMVRSADRTVDAVDGMRRATEQWDAAAAHWQDAAARLDAGMHRLTGAPSLAVPPSGGSPADAGTAAGSRTSS
ncbi:hypothetical protein [Actinacidiphila acididurans]|uniref:Methyl-accepting chemotaxis protein n=1 Tax=Actinacidiphila acididurans TaxID=2784346 RepID=A0ABS2U4Y1_9ACTN|nr:hypothetical protein [Actinacidiphila acididurans]MBM9510678.1 hypothetical protein [Actinacidiphila acididurans]